METITLKPCHGRMRGDERDLAMLQSDDWPTSTGVPIKYCCLKRYDVDGQRLFGYMVKAEIVEFTVFIGPPDRKSEQQVVYASYDEVVADGWMVD